MNYLNLVWEYRFVIALVVSFVSYGLFEKEKVKSLLYGLMLDAKGLAKDKVLNSGKEQEDWVVERAYMYLPKKVTVFISKELMRKIIKFLYDTAKDYLDDGKLNKSV